MPCTTCQELLQRLLDGADAGAPAALDAHVPACPEGGAGADAARRLADALRRLTPPAPPPELAGRLTAAVGAEARARLRARRLRAARAGLAALAVAAGLVLVVSLW